ncbi:MAG: hypothetical protein BWX87_02645 [Bacteroidetes bacterium ADurb.Bin123]|nr:MAG: hypothetical protein BWX87_02645 [Bacteroidetes bacterium ADurb.Bin123]
MANYRFIFRHNSCKNRDMAKYIEFRRILSLIPHLPPASFYSPFAGSWRPPLTVAPKTMPALRSTRFLTMYCPSSVNE